MIMFLLPVMCAVMGDSEDDDDEAIDVTVMFQGEKNVYFHCKK